MLELSRRDLLLAGTGAAAGIALSPVPWKLLDDLSIWTQQPPTPTPRPAGPLGFRSTSCSLCPAACGLRARCFGSQPVSFAPVAGHPASDGGLCPLGLTAHHLAKHPLRAAAAERVSGGRRERIDRAAAVAALSAALGTGAKDAKRAFAIVDGRPGRSLSRTYRALAAAAGGHYVTPPATGIARSLETLSARCDGAPALGFDAARARRVLSFGAPVLADAGVPGRLVRLRADSRCGPKEGWIEVIHAGALKTKSASLADRFFAIAPGTEATLALGIAHVLLDEKLADASFLASRTTGLPGLEALAARFAPELVAQRTGVPAGEVAALARDLAAHGPAVTLGGDALAPLSDEAEAAIAVLNLLLGAPAGAIVPRGTAPRPADGDARLASATSLDAVPDGSVGVLLLDASVAEGLLPWKRVEKKLADGAFVASFSPFRAGLGEKAGLLLPGPAPLEEAVELDGAPDAPAATFSLAPALIARPKDVLLPADLLAEAATAAGLALPPDADCVAAIAAARRGKVFDPASGELLPVADAAAIAELLGRGGCWVDDPTPPPAARFALLREGEAPRLLEAALGDPKAAPSLPATLPFEPVSAAPPSPLLTKLTRETSLFPAPPAVTARA
jgi:hypothetical protein